jgi:NADH-quinone oxidoreductase subunit F
MRERSTASSSSTLEKGDELERYLTRNIRPDREAFPLAEYEHGGGYQGLRRALSMSPLQVQELVDRSGLRGRGGAGFPTGKKWSFVPMGEKVRGPKYYVVNADEMEPGTMKDRLLLEGDPHQVVEGALIGAYAVQAEVIYIYLRWAYRLAGRRLRDAIAEANEKGYLVTKILGSRFNAQMYLHESSGRYICGEEDGLMDALEGRRPIPRPKPPFPQTCGLWGRPTVVNNVETVSNLPGILRHGDQWFKDLSLSDDGGTKIYGVSGRVKRPGTWELPLGTSAREVIFEHAGGMADGARLRAFLPGGGSTDFLTEEQLDVQMDYASVAAAGSRLGTGTIVVLDDRTCPVSVLISLERFFARESCGWCTPCREGLPWVLSLLEELEEGNGREETLELLEFHCRTIKPGVTFCSLAPGAMEPLESALKYFREDMLRHVRERRCPWR